MNDELLIASAGADLYKRAALPASEDAAATAIANHAAAYLNGQVWFPILSTSEAASLFQRDDLGLGGLGSALKKAVKKVAGVVKTAAPLAAGLGVGIVSGNPAAGIGAMQLTGAVIGATQKPPSIPAGNESVTAYVPTTTLPPQVQVAEPMVLGVPERYLPYIAIGFLAVVVLSRR